MAEQDCSKHIKRLRVSLDQSRLEKNQHYNLIAALLRSLAEYTDGFCAAKRADDDHLAPNKSMSFWFTSDEKRDKFDNRIAIYLRRDLNGALSRTKG